MDNIMSGGIKNHNRDRYERVRRLMWIKCEACGRLVFYKDYKNNHYVCPRCNRAFIMNPKQRFDLLFDDVDWQKFDFNIPVDDPLDFTDRVSYKERLAEAREDTGARSASASPPYFYRMQKSGNRNRPPGGPTTDKGTTLTT